MNMQTTIERGDLIEAERAGNNRLANIIRHRQQQWKDSLAEALAA